MAEGKRERSAAGEKGSVRTVIEVTITMALATFGGWIWWSLLPTDFDVLSPEDAQAHLKVAIPFGLLLTVPGFVVRQAIPKRKWANIRLGAPLIGAELATAFFSYEVIVFWLGDPENNLAEPLFVAAGVMGIVFHQLGRITDNDEWEVYR